MKWKGTGCVENRFVFGKIATTHDCRQNYRSRIPLGEQGQESDLIGSDRIESLPRLLFHFFLIQSMNTILLVLAVVAVSIVAICIAWLWYMGFFR